ncbi:MAG: VanZ family protein [Burkholderiales bacterium]|nr:VanZ family protein [Burkholderiales bacterium]
MPLLALQAVSKSYGALIECLQYPVPYRSFSILDMATNAAGATLGAVVLLGALALSEHRR